MFPTIIAIRNERVVAAVSTPRMAVTLHCAQSLGVGLDPQALVVAAQAEVDGSPTPAIAYTVMTRDRRAGMSLQQVQTSPEGTLAFSAPAKVEQPTDPRIMEVLAEAMAQRPLAVTKVARRDAGGTFGEDLYLPPEQGRVVVDAGAMRGIHEQVQKVRGQALYVARSPEAAKLALEAGLPRACLLS